MSLFESINPGAPKHPPTKLQSIPPVDYNQQSTDLEAFHQSVQAVMSIEGHHPIETRHGVGISFWGTLIRPAAEIYDELNRIAEKRGYTVYLQKKDHFDEVIFAEGILTARNINVPWFFHLLLLLITIGTTLIAGSLLTGYNWSAVKLVLEELAFGSLEFHGSWPFVELNIDQNAWSTFLGIYRDGSKFAFPLLLILGTHEMGHYVAARLHGVKVTLPFFIPLPIFGTLGTLGAVIFIKSPFLNRKMLFDIGIAGPLAGLIVAIGVFLWGLNGPATDGIPLQWIQGAGINRVAVPPFLEWIARLVWTDSQVDKIDRSIFYNYPQALAGWFGILLTSLNLLPLGQFDGGHIAFAVFGRRIAWTLAIVGAILCVVMALTSSWIAWLLWPVMAVLTGLRHPPPHDDITPLGWPRRLLGIIVFVLFFTMIVITPFYSTLR